MDLIPFASDIVTNLAHYVVPAIGAWFGARGRVERLERDLADHKRLPVPPAHALGNGTTYTEGHA